MNELKKLFEAPVGRKARLALFLSGSGSNASRILEIAAQGDCSYEVAVLVTDAPESSAAAELGEKYSLPVVALDIRRFYADHGESGIALNSAYRRELRDKWSDELYKEVVKFEVDAGILAGFIPLSNIVGKLPCLNVHPGDLTVTENGVRILAGLHYRPVETAILRNFELRSSVILAQNYQGDGKKEQDSGPILGISAPVEIDLEGHSLEELQAISDSRTTAPYDDLLRKLAHKNVEKLKIQGDHVVFPMAIEHFVRGDYATDECGTLYFCCSGKWEPIKTVEFRADGSSKLIFSAPESNVKSRPKRNFILRFAKFYYTKIIRTPGTPDFVARGWALGVAVGCIVPVFCQLLVAIPLSFICRCSKIGAIAGTFITTPPTAIFIYPVLIWVGNKIINGDLSSDSAAKLLEIFNNSNYTFTQKWQAFADMGGDLVAAFFAGGIAWAIIMVPITYFGVKKLVISYRRVREARRAKVNTGK